MYMSEAWSREEMRRREIATMLDERARALPHPHDPSLTAEHFLHAMLYRLDSRLVSDMLGSQEEKSPLISVASVRQIGVPVCQINQYPTVRQICQRLSVRQSSRECVRQFDDWRAVRQGKDKMTLDARISSLVHQLSESKKKSRTRLVNRNWDHKNIHGSKSVCTRTWTEDRLCVRQTW